VSHRVVIDRGVIENDQAVVPTTWDAVPRTPLEVLRTIYSFDPCLACAVHRIDPSHRDITTGT
jgi:hydrogenase large subunit